MYNNLIITVMINHVIRPAHDTNLSNAHAAQRRATAPVEIHPGSLHHADEIQPGTLHHADEIQPGTLHHADEIQPGTLHNQISLPR